MLTRVVQFRLHSFFLLMRSHIPTRRPPPAGPFPSSTLGWPLGSPRSGTWAPLGRANLATQRASVSSRRPSLPSCRASTPRHVRLCSGVDVEFALLCLKIGSCSLGPKLPVLESRKSGRVAGGSLSLVRLPLNPISPVPLRPPGGEEALV